MNGSGGGGTGGLFYTGGFTGFGGGAQMSGSSSQQPTDRQAAGQTTGQHSSPLQQQLFQIGKILHEACIVFLFSLAVSSVRKPCEPVSNHLMELLMETRCFVFAASALHNRASQSSRQTAAAILQYCSTGDARVLLAVQRHLCGVQDGNGDT